MCCFGPKFGQRREESGQLPIQHFAAYDGRMWLLSWILQHHGRAALDEELPQDGTTPLLWAVKAENLEVVRWLLENGAGPNITGHFIVEKTFKRRFNAGKEDKVRKPETIKQYYTALSIAAVEHPQVFKLLLDFSADINFKSSTGQSSLSLAAYRFGTRFITFNVCKLFLENGADPNITTDIEYPLLHAAAGSGFYLNTVALLLNHGADRNLRDRNRRTPLHWAAYHERLEALILLCTSGGEVNARDNEGHPALYYAALYGTPLVVNVLVEYGADLAQFQDGARIHDNQHWRNKVWKGTELVNRMELLPRTRKDRVRFEQSC
jgi:ankyrin repeat protein